VATAHINGYQPYGFGDFSGGLNLRDKVDAVGDKEAIDLLNVNFAQRGAILQRDGYVDFTPADLSARVDSLAPFYSTSGLKQLVAGAGTRLDVLSSVGAVLASLTGTGGGPYNFARFGDPTHEWLFAANGIDAIARWDGVSWTTGGALATVDGTPGRALPKAGAICMTAMHQGSSSGQSASNRLVATAFGTQTAAGPGGTPSTPSRVYFSNPGDPLVWETDGNQGVTPKRGRNWIDLAPGDGEQIMAAVAWRELVFIFKETKFFVVWGETTAVDSGGNVITDFMVREVVNAVGLASKLAITVGRDGVYFLNRRGIYVTTGDQPQLLSDIVGPMWTQDPEIYFRSSPINLAHLELCRLHWHMEKLYAAVPTGAAAACDRTLVYDILGKWWSLYDLPVSALASFRPDVRPLLHFGYASGPVRVGRHAPGTTVDRGANTIISRWRSGFSDYDLAVEKTFRSTEAWGTGAAIVSFFTDYRQGSDVDVDVLFGEAGKWPVNGAGTWGQWLQTYNNKWPGGGVHTVAPIRKAVRGTVFSTQFSNSPQAASWSVHRVTRHLRETRSPALR
jgi:hypothetical protein